MYHSYVIRKLPSVCNIGNTLKVLQNFFAIATTKFYVCEEKSYTQRTISTIYKSRPTTRAAFP